MTSRFYAICLRIASVFLACGGSGALRLGPGAQSDALSIPQRNQSVKFFVKAQGVFGAGVGFSGLKGRRRVVARQERCSRFVFRLVLLRQSPSVGYVSGHGKLLNSVDDSRHGQSRAIVCPKRREFARNVPTRSRLHGSLQFRHYHVKLDNMLELLCAKGESKCKQ